MSSSDSQPKRRRVGRDYGHEGESAPSSSNLFLVAISKLHEVINGMDKKLECIQSKMDVMAKELEEVINAGEQRDAEVRGFEQDFLGGHLFSDDEIKDIGLKLAQLKTKISDGKSKHRCLQTWFDEASRQDKANAAT